MTKQNTIALIVDPGSGERIRDVAAHARHTWVVTSDIEDLVVPIMDAPIPPRPRCADAGGWRNGGSCPVSPRH